MRDFITKLTIGTVAVAMAASLGGCADSLGGGPFPSLGAASTNVDQKLMSREEKSSAIRELSSERAAQRETAIREIEKP